MMPRCQCRLTALCKVAIVSSGLWTCFLMLVMSNPTHNGYSSNPNSKSPLMVFPWASTFCVGKFGSPSERPIARRATRYRTERPNLPFNISVILSASALVWKLETSTFSKLISLITDLRSRHSWWLPSSPRHYRFAGVEADMTAQCCHVVHCKLAHRFPCLGSTEIPVGSYQKSSNSR